MEMANIRKAIQEALLNNRLLPYSYWPEAPKKFNRSLDWQR
jgi:hypothetical protein